MDTNGNGVADAGDAYWRNGAGWEPIGQLLNTGFGSKFEGNNKTISNLYVNYSGSGATGYAGLFGYVGAGGSIENVGIASGSVSIEVTNGDVYAGGLVGYAYTSVRIAGSHSLADVRAESNHNNTFAGGLAGIAIGPVVDSYAGGSVRVTNENLTAGTASAGGLIGYVDGSGSVTGSYATGNVHVEAANLFAYAGGLVGQSAGDIDDSYATGSAEASGPGATRAGGLVGNASASITGSYATGSATATSGSGKTAYAAGLVGQTNADVTASYATGAATATSPDNDAAAGGLVGNTDNVTVRAAYATGDATASGSTAQAAGGLVGNVLVNLNLHDSYATGRPTVRGSAIDDNTHLGGVIGSGNASIGASYWDVGTSGVAAADDSNGTGTSTLALQRPTNTSTSTLINNPYATWGDSDLDGDNENDLPWEFGTNAQYPILVFSTSIRASQQRPKVSLRLSPGSISENRGAANLSASLDRASNVATTLTVASTAAGTDVNLSGTTITISPEGSSSRVRVTAIDDGVYRPRTVSFTAQVQPGGSGADNPDAVTLALTDDEPMPPTTPGDGAAPAPTPEPTSTPSPTATPIPVTVVPESQITPVPAPAMGASAIVHPDRSTVLTSGNVTVTFPPRSRPWSFQATLDTSPEACSSAGNTTAVELPCATVQVYDTSGNAESNVTLIAPARIQTVLSADQVNDLGGMVVLYSAHLADGLKMMRRDGPDGAWREISMELELSSETAALTSTARAGSAPPWG